MTVGTAAQSVPTTWIDTHPVDIVDDAIKQLRRDDPDGWTLFAGDRTPRYALWAYLALGHADSLPLPAAMDLVDALRSPAGPAAYQSGMSPGEAAMTLSRRDDPQVRPGYDPPEAYPAHPVEVDQ